MGEVLDFRKVDGTVGAKPRSSSMILTRGKQNVYAVSALQGKASEG
jgi:hypothetical protein